MVNEIQCRYVDINLTAKRPRQSAVSSESEAVNEDGVLVNLEVQSVDGSGPTCEAKTADIEQFFGEAYDHPGANGKVKKTPKVQDLRVSLSLNIFRFIYSRRGVGH
jgi:hypothetical protein